MPRKRVKSKKKNDSYRYMEPYGSLHCALYWVDLDKIKLDWTDTELINQLWEWHGKKIMELWWKENRPAQRPKIWWHANVDPKDIKILGHKEGKPVFESESAFLERNNLLEPWEIEMAKREPWVLARKTDDHLPFDYSIIQQYDNGKK